MRQFHATRSRKFRRGVYVSSFPFSVYEQWSPFATYACTSFFFFFSFFFVLHMLYISTLGTRRVLKRYRNGTINICNSKLEHFLNTSVVLVLLGYSKGARKVWKVHERHACSTQKVSSRYQAVNHLRDYFSWITSRRQAQFLADLSWSVMPRFVLTTHMTERAVAQ